MLRALYIRDLLLFREADLDLSPGLNILSGESGVGKSLVIYAIALLLGARFDRTLLKGESRASVSGVWTVSAGSAVAGLLSEQGLELEDGDRLTLRRQLGSNGQAFVNDCPVSLKFLTRLGLALEELYGQFSAHRLAEGDYQRRLVDEFAALTDLAAESRRGFLDWQEHAAAFDGAEAEFDALSSKMEFVSHALEEFEALDLKPGEYEELQQLRSALRREQSDQERLQQADALFQSDVSVMSQLDHLSSLLEGSEDPELEVLREGLERARIEVDEVSRTISRKLFHDRSSSMGLEEVEERLFRISALARKHDTVASGLEEVRETLSGQVGALEALAGRKHVLGENLERVHRSLTEVQGRLSERRRVAAEDFSARVTSELPGLNMAEATFVAEVVPLEAPSAGGGEQVQFLLRTQPDAELRGLLKVASGGELSRLLLAMALSMGTVESASRAGVLVFDEVDAGIGGETAAVLGGRLRKLARGRQIVAVTHSPQMAASAEDHFGVEKTLKGDQVESRVRMLEGLDRREEIARMLAGEEITEAARHAAQALLEAQSAVDDH